MTDAMNHADYAEYLRRRSWTGKLYRQWLLYPRLSRHVHGRALDFGCGIGDFLQFRRATVGADINPFNVEFCRKRGLDAHLIAADGRLPFPDRHFNTVVMDNVLEHIAESEVDAVIGELLRVLRPSGRMLVGVPGSKGYAADPDHKCFYTLDDLKALMARYGCRLVKSFAMPLNWPMLESVLSQYCIYALFQADD